MRTAILIAALALAACNHAPAHELLECRPDPALMSPADRASEVTLTVERKDGDLVWTDTNGIEHRITAADSWQWRCAPRREI